jgi:hypothetical protein
MSTSERHHGHHPSAFVAAAAVVGILGASAVAGVVLHEHNAGASGPPAHHLVLPDYRPPLHPSAVQIHRAEALLAERSAGATRNARRAQLGE